MPIVPVAAGAGQQSRQHSNVHVVIGNPRPDILVVCDAMMASDRRAMEAWNTGQPTSQDALNLAIGTATKAGLDKNRMAFMRLCPPMSEVDRTSEKRKWGHVEQHVEDIRATVAKLAPRLVVTLGELASRAMLGHSVKITKARGTLEQAKNLDVQVMPMLSPGFVLRVPEHMPLFAADWRTVATMAANNFTTDGMVKIETDYQWRSDLSDVLANRPRAFAVDTETTGLNWYEDEVFGFLWQMTIRPGQTFLVPIHERYWVKVFPELPVSQMETVKQQIASLMEDASIKKIGHNLKYDWHIMRKVPILREDGHYTPMKPRGFYLDTEIMAFQADENMLQRNLDECTRVWVPEMAGYADSFNATTDKGRMIDVPPEDVYDENQKIVTYGMRNYAGGDTDSCLRLAQRLRDILQKDKRQWNVMRRVQIPANMMFTEVTEPAGVLIDQDRLHEFGQELDEHTREEYKWLIRQVPAAIRKKHMAAAMSAGKDGTKKQADALSSALSFTRPDFTRDVLFTKEGMGLKPVVFTESTRALPPEQREPSTSAKEHFPYFVTHATRGEFVTRLGDFLKAKHMSATYVGKRADANGFWQYIGSDGSIHPSFSLTRTNTGRTASSNPNGQNFPKRGRWSKPYQRIFVPRAGKVFGASDMSQIELRLIAWTANEATMLDVYRNNGDIHASTAAIALGLTAAEFAEWKTDAVLLRDVLDLPGAKKLYDETKPEKRAALTLKALHALQRFRAKAVNFGFCYGAMAETFRTYAKTQYGADFTSEEAELIRNRYFEKYRLEPWHEAMRSIAHRNGYVRSLHGAARHLPSIFSADRKTVSSTERQAINAPIQRFGSDLCLIGAYRFQSQVHPDIARVVLTVHDQVVLEIEQGYEEAILPVLCWAMQNPPLEEWFGITPPLPFGSDAELSAASLGEMEERPDLVAAKPLWWNDREQDVIQSFIDGDPMWTFTPDMTPEDAQAALVPQFV